MAKAKRARRNSIRTMDTDGSALAALEALERAEVPTERVPEQLDAEGAVTATADPEKE